MAQLTGGRAAAGHPRGGRAGDACAWRLRSADCRRLGDFHRLGREGRGRDGEREQAATGLQAVLLDCDAQCRRWRFEPAATSEFRDRVVKPPSRPSRMAVKPACARLCEPCRNRPPGSPGRARRARAALSVTRHEKKAATHAPRLSPGGMAATARSARNADRRQALLRRLMTTPRALRPASISAVSPGSGTDGVKASWPAYSPPLRLILPSTSNS